MDALLHSLSVGEYEIYPKRKKNTPTLGLKLLVLFSEDYRYEVLTYPANSDCDKQPPFLYIYLCMQS
jgi:hypothetical protein